MLSAIAGSMEALLSVITRTGKLQFDCSSGRMLHYLEGASRIWAGALSGIVVALAIRTEMFLAPLARGEKLRAVMIIAAFAAGAVERLAASIISTVGSDMRSCRPANTRTQRKAMALIRKALIITNPGEIGGETYCEGANKDPLIYKSFMLSGLGGVWQPGEITTLKRPLRLEALNAISALRGADYSVVAFCGHGFYSGPKDSTILELKSGVQLDSVELRQGATKRTIILDCCREIHTKMALDEAMEKAIAKAEHVVDPVESRQYFDQQLSNCAKGVFRRGKRTPLRG